LAKKAVIGACVLVGMDTETTNHGECAIGGGFRIRSGHIEIALLYDPRHHTWVKPRFRWDDDHGWWSPILYVVEPGEYVWCVLERRGERPYELLCSVVALEPREERKEPGMLYTPCRGIIVKKYETQLTDIRGVSGIDIIVDMFKSIHDLDSLFEKTYSVEATERLMKWIYEN
jgi:hypothetical protein